MKMNRLIAKDSKAGKIMTGIKEWYIVCFLTFLLLSRMVCFVQLVGNRVNGALYILGAAAGGVILLLEVMVHFKRYLRLEYYLLFGFIFCCLISSFVYRSYGLGDNIKNLAWMAIQFGVFTTLVPFGSPDEKSGRRGLRRLMNSLLFVHLAAVTISFVQFLLQISYVVPDYNETYDRRQGFVEERLFGVFTDPNYAAMASIIMILFSLILWRTIEKKWLRRLHVFSVVMNAIYILLSGSRTAMVACCLVFPVTVYFLLRNERLEKGLTWHVRGVLTSAGVLAALLLYFAFFPYPFAALADVTQSISPFLGVEKQTQEPVSLEREDGREDVSNNRFDIWSSVWEISGDNRLLGLSPRNMVEYAKQNHPTSYIAQSGYQAHNAYLAVIAGTGILGSVVVLAFIVYLVVLLIRYIKLHKKKVVDAEVLLGISVMSSIGISGLFLLEIFFVNTITAGLFWLFTGFIFMYLKPYERQAE